MPDDIFPNSDAEFYLWSISFEQFVMDNKMALNVSDAKAMALSVAQGDWVTKYLVSQNRDTRTQPSIELKDEARKVLKKLLRVMIGKIQADDEVEDSMRVSMAIKIHSHSRAAIPAPGTFPVLRIDFSVRLQHRIHYHDIATPLSAARPYGAVGLQLWSQENGVKPVDNKGMTYVGDVTESGFLIAYTGEQAGSTMYYLGRWVNARGEHGPWCVVVEADIAR